MGNFMPKKATKIDVQLLQLVQALIDITKKDIARSYDLSTVEGVAKANKELINAFSNFSEADINHVKTQLFYLPKNPEPAPIFP
jgi:hypothetical protein